MVHKFKVEREMPLEDLILKVGDIVDGVSVNEQITKVFVRNGWWAVDSACLSQLADSADEKGLLPPCPDCHQVVDEHGRCGCK
jgi:hypothetical protein